MEVICRRQAAGAAKAVNGAASQAVSESIVIAKMGNQTIKIAVK